MYNTSMMDFTEQLALVREQNEEYLGGPMEHVLMLKDAPVFNAANGEVYNEQLLPGCLRKDPRTEIFAKWMSARYSTFSNAEARMLFTPSFGHSKRQVIDSKTRALSLSDCYWVKNKEDSVTFKEISPYYNAYWTGTGRYEGGPIPTLYVNGVLSKKWDSAEWLTKFGGNIEMEYECSLLFSKFISSVTIIKKENNLKIRNFTDTDIMFEPANLSGIFGIDDVIADLWLIEKIFGRDGAMMLLLDSIIGNVDRHTGNFGYLRDTNTGAYIGMAPMFDWDRAGGDDECVLISRLAEFIKGHTEHLDMISEVLRKINSATDNGYFRKRADKLKYIFKG